VIGLLRFVGILNGAVWLGATVFFVLSVAPAGSGLAMQNLLGPKNYPYFSVAIVQLLADRYFHLYLACAMVALLHLVAEWLYFGRYPDRVFLALLIGLCLAGLLQVYWLQPRLEALHDMAYQTQTLRPEQRDPPLRAFQVTRATAGALNWFMLAGLVGYLWRLAHPPDLPRFVSATKFRS